MDATGAQVDRARDYDQTALSHVPNLHVGGKSALGLQGVRHNLGDREPVVLWGDVRFVLPAWFTTRFPARYSPAHLFDWPSASLAAKTLTTPPGAYPALKVAVPERAVLELLYAAPDVFDNDMFAMKGGTAINLFVQDMPRLSVDIDVIYLRRDVPRDDALKEIAGQLEIIADRLSGLGLQTRLIPSKDLGDTKLIVENETSQVWVEVNAVFRGSVLPIERRGLSTRAAERFSVELELPMRAHDELYGSKLVAAMDRQHPRDLFDVWQLFESGGITDAMIECFVTYLAGHNRPVHEVPFPKDRDLTTDYHGGFVGMTETEASLETLQQTRERLRQELPARLNRQQREFLISLARAQPEWKLLKCRHAAELLALRWKLNNLEMFQRRRPTDFEQQAKMLESRLR